MEGNATPTAMEGSVPPTLPEPIAFADASDECEGLIRLGGFWGDPEADPLEEDGATARPFRPFLVEEFIEALVAEEGAAEAGEAPPDQEARTLLRLRFQAPIRDVAGVCRGIMEAHRPEHGVAQEKDKDLVMVLPTGVSWSAVVQTACRMEPMAGQRVTAGLADFTESPDSLVHAFELTQMGVARAAAAGQPVCMLDLETLLLEEECMRQEARVAEALLQALRSGTGLRLVYQPKYDLKSGEMIGAEGLLRFECDHLGALGPSEFLPIAERAGLRTQVERWVLDAGIAAIARWQHEDVLRFPVSLNVAPADFFGEHFVDELKQWIEVSKVDASLVRLELPERGLALASGEAIKARLGAIRGLGVSVALDDVGESDTQLAGIRGLDIDALHIHRSLILQMAFCRTTSAVVRGILSLARALEIETVAAGVETESQLASLREYGCSIVQGYLLSRPVEEAAFGALLRTAR